MSTAPGDDRFEILERLGAGGMGEVYRARDRKLNRFVALKFLPDAASDSARERFEREAQAVAALSHPNICTLHETGEQDGRAFLVLELLEGETLQARLARGPLAADALLDFSLQIAEALDAAHKRGILHRDLKPSNIWVSPGGHVKVLDFGLAKLQAEEAAAEAPTISGDPALTSPGTTLGTAPYMSPEQARGEPTDARSDLFSFGAVLYEMAAGRAAFARRSTAETHAAILKEQPPALATARPDLPPKLDEVIERCLEKDPDLRYQSAADLRSELKRLKRGSSSSSTHAAFAPATPAPAAVVARHGSPWRWLAPAIVVLLAAAVFAWWRSGRAAAPPPALSFRQLTFSGNIVDAVISPDGKFLAHVDNGPQGTSLHLLSVANGSDVTIVPPTAGCCTSPSFSPDGSQVYFLLNRDMKAVPVLGGAVRNIAKAVCSGAGFSPDGSQIAYVAEIGAASTSVMLAHPDGSSPRLLHTAAAGSGYISQCWGIPGSPTHAPAWSPDGRWIALADAAQNQNGHIELDNARDGSARDLAPNTNFGAWDASWSGSNSLVFTASLPATAPPELWSVTFPGGRLTRLTNDLQGYSGVSAAANGQLALSHSTPQYSVWAQAGAGGTFQQLPGGGADQDGDGGLAWTAEGHLVSLRDMGGNIQIWGENADGSDAHVIWAGASPTQLAAPLSVPNGQIVIEAVSGTNSIFRVNADGTGMTELVNPEAGGQALSPQLADGDRTVIYLNAEKDNSQTIWAVPLAGGAAHQVWSGFVFVDGNPVSPDGARMFVLARGNGPDAHVPTVVRLDGGRPQAVPLAGFDVKTMLTPYRWTADSKAITFIENQGTTDNIWAFPIAGGKPYALTHFTDLRIAAYAFSHDGRLAISRGSANTDVVLATPAHP